jgi:molecular chaperone HscB
MRAQPAMQNHFDLFNLPQRFAIDGAALDTAYRDVQSRVHPDRFVNASDSEKRVAMQWTTRANEAYQTLKSPLQRARYLCELNGVDLQTESNTAMPPAFLMQQMEWRERLEEAERARGLDSLEELAAELKVEKRTNLVRIEQLLNQGDYAAAAQQVRALMFLEKFGAEIDGAFDALD